MRLSNRSICISRCLNRRQGALLFSHRFESRRANGFPNTRQRSTTSCLRLNGGLETMMSHRCGSYSKKSCPVKICEYSTLYPPLFQRKDKFAVFGIERTPDNGVSRQVLDDRHYRMMRCVLFVAQRTFPVTGINHSRTSSFSSFSLLKLKDSSTHCPKLSST